MQAQRFDASAVPSGPQFQVNTYITLSQIEPAVASDGLGNFVVVWQSYGSSGTDASYSSIQGQRYDSAGNPVGAEFQANTYTPLTQYTPAVASDSQGNFVVVWSSGGASAGDTASYSIQARRYLANGTPVAGEFQVNSYTNGDQTFPAVSIDGVGRFVVAWRSLGSSGTDYRGHQHPGAAVRRRRHSAGRRVPGQHLHHERPERAYRRRRCAGQLRRRLGEPRLERHGRERSYSTQAQRYRANGAALGGQFQVNSFTTSNQDSPDVASDSRRQLRRRLGQHRLEWHRQQLSQRPGPALRRALPRRLRELGTGRWSAAVP